MNKPYYAVFSKRTIHTSDDRGDNSFDVDEVLKFQTVEDLTAWIILTGKTPYAKPYEVVLCNPMVVKTEIKVELVEAGHGITS